MSQYIIRRLIAFVPLMIVVSIIIFVFLRLLPGNVVDALTQENPSISVSDRQALARAYGLDGSWPRQYLRWLAGIVRGDFGTSFISHVPVREEFAKRAPVTLELTVLALLFAATVAIGLGVVAAVYVDTPFDHIARSIAILGVSVPSFWWGTVAVVYPAVWWHVSPPIAYKPFTSDPIGNLEQFLLPSLILGAVASASVARLARSATLEVLRMDYMRTASSKGLARRVVVMRHALPNALLPVITLLGVLAATLISGTVVIESIFQLQGLGLYVFTAIGKRDYPIIQSTTLLLSLIIMAINLAIDLLYGVIDPRVKVGA